MNKIIDSPTIDQDAIAYKSMESVRRQSNDGNQLDIALIVRPSVVGHLVPFPELHLSAYIRERGFSVKIINKSSTFKRELNASGPDFDDCMKMIMDDLLIMKPKVVGIGCYSSDYAMVMTMATMIKNELDCKIIVGNVHATNAPEDFISCDSPVDIAVIGEGEITLTELLSSDLDDPADLKKINGICYYDSDNGVVRTEDRKLIPDLKVLPMPAYDLIDMDYYAVPRKTIIGFVYYSVIPLFIGRGCPYKCTYCVSNTSWLARGLRLRPIDNVIEEIKYLKDTYKIDAVYLLDDTFTAHKKLTREFCEKISPLNLTWAAQTRVNLIDDELLGTMKDAGCMELTFGVETGSPRMLEITKKGTKAEDAVKAFDLCRKHKVRSLANIMFNLPKETEKDVRLNFDHYKTLNPDEFGAGLTVPYPGSSIYNEYVDPPLAKDEYWLLAAGRGKTGNRFRLASHDLDLEEILVSFRTSLRLQHLIPGFMRILIKPSYLKTIFKSAYTYEYIREITKAIPSGIIRIVGMLLLNVMRLAPVALRQPFNRFALNYGARHGNLAE